MIKRVNATKVKTADVNVTYKQAERAKTDDGSAQLGLGMADDE
jgi:hypothetical protein